MSTGLAMQAKSFVAWLLADACAVSSRKLRMVFQIRAPLVIDCYLPYSLTGKNNPLDTRQL